MDCNEIERDVLAGRPPIGPEAEAHLAGCPACRYLATEGTRLAASLGAGRPSGTPAGVTELEAAVLADLRRERGSLARLRETPRSVRAVLLAVLVGLEALFIYTYLRRADWVAYPGGRMAVIVGAFAAIALGLGWLALRPLYLRPLPAWTERAIFGAAVVVPFLLTLLPVLPTAPLAGFSYPGFAFRCFAYATSLALFVIVVGRALDRGRGGRFAMLSTVAAGAYSGLVGLQLECPVNDPLHLLFGHAIVPLGLLLGVWALRRI